MPLDVRLFHWFGGVKLCVAASNYPEDPTTSISRWLASLQAKATKFRECTCTFSSSSSTSPSFEVLPQPCAQHALIAMYDDDVGHCRDVDCITWQGFT